LRAKELNEVLRKLCDKEEFEFRPKKLENVFEELTKYPSEPRGLHRTLFEYYSLRRAVNHILQECAFVSLKRGIGMSLIEVKTSGPGNQFKSIVYV
jgi:hypothetical protein